MTMVKHTAYPSVGDTQVLIRVSKPELKELAINCTRKQYLCALEAYKDGKLIQDAFSFLNASEREFLMSGILPSEFDAAFSDD